ncbi:cation:proton antiporter [Paenibacillus sp. Leaf72]|uniref:cation:proton antiporter n=1 Tax=Paenibacillus sp. Leaf72 TaxID=1736234 RepID=UPI0006FB5866|nr:cation:proton antiporter [Paenibacillus sp. Leaf72]KQO10634.1 sodium:proton antiporter [Paenibacillus sp. Leaf72]
MEFILTLMLIIAVSKIAGALSVKAGQPAVLGKLLAGIVVGPALLGWVDNSDWLAHFSEIGVLLLMFIAGLETDLEQLRKDWKASFSVALGGIILPFAGGYGAAVLFGLSSAQAIFLGLLLSATSVSISVQTLKEMNKLSSREGTTILGAAVVDDVVVVVLLAVVMSLLGSGGDVSIPLMLGKKVLFFAVIIAASWWLVPFVMKRLARFPVTEAAISAALVICFGFAYFADAMGVAGIIGAFAAGIAIGQTPLRHTVETKIEPIAYSLFVPVFFISIGLNVTFAGIGEQIGFIALLSVVAILTKLFGAAAGARLTGFNMRSSIGIGAGMISRGEVALIIAASGLQSALLPQAYFTPVVLVIMVTTLVTPPLMKQLFKREQPAN